MAEIHDEKKHSMVQSPNVDQSAGDHDDGESRSPRRCGLCQLRIQYLDLNVCVFYSNREQSDDMESGQSVWLGRLGCHIPGGASHLIRTHHHRDGGEAQASFGDCAEFWNNDDGHRQV